MAKKQAYYAQAEKLYIEERLPITAISSRLEVSEKTLREWKKEGDWETKKISFLQSQNNCHALLYKLVEKFAEKIKTDLDEGNQPEASTLYFLKGMIDKLPKLKSYEESIVEDACNKKESKASAEDMMDRITEILGM